MDNWGAKIFDIEYEDVLLVKDNYVVKCRISATSVNIPNTVIGIGYEAFRNCSNLTSITIPNSVTSIATSAFYGCSSLASVNIPNSVTSIGISAFSGCSSLASVNIPNSVTSISHEAFSGTAWYDNQPDGLVYAGKVAYKYKGTMPTNCSIEIEEGTIGIAGSAFCDCTSLTSVTIPNSVTSIVAPAFRNCYNLNKVVCMATTPPVINSYTFSQYSTLIVPRGSKNAYQSADYWKEFTILSKLDITDSDPYIPETNYEIGEIEYTRTGIAISENKYGTFCLPYDIDLSQTNCFKKVYTPVNVCFYNTKTGYINLFFKERKLNTAIPANTPFIAQLTGDDVVLTNSNAFYVTGALSDPEPITLDVFNYNGSDGALLENTDIEVKFGGNVTPKDKDTGMFTFNTDGSFSPMQSATLKPFRAYVLKNSQTSNVKGISVNFGDAEDEATAIELMKQEAEASDSRVYTIDGKAVNENLQHLPKGIYIVNGKKIIK